MSELIQPLGKAKLRRNGSNCFLEIEVPESLDGLAEDVDVMVYIQTVPQVGEACPNSNLSAISDAEWTRACSANEAFDFLKDDEACEGLFDPAEYTPIR
jgi:hypothetical protein